MDIDDMQGLIVDVMVKVVEDVDIVLICYFRKYYESFNCRVGLYRE